MNEIQSLLSRNFNFEEGFALFCKYSRRESLIKYIARKRDMVALRYNLEKVLKYGCVKPNPSALINITRYAPKIASSLPLLSPKPEPVATPLVAGNEEKAAKELFVRHEHIDRNTLPEDIRALYDTNTMSYKEMRVYFEKMKLASDNEKRAELRKKVVELDKAIRKRWVTIDNYIKGKSPQDEDKSPQEVDFNPNTYRATISRYLKKEALTNKEREICADRAKALIDNGYAIKPSTINLLIERGLYLEK